MGNEFGGPIIAQQARSEPLMAAMLNFNVNLELEPYRISHRNNPQTYLNSQ